MKHQTFSSLCLFIPPHPSHILERFKKGRPNIPKQQRPSSKGKTLIQRDCSIGDFLLVKKKNEQKPLFFRKKSKTKKQKTTPNHTQHGNKAQISTEPHNGSRHHPATPARTTDKLFRVSEKQHRHCWGSDRAQQFMSALLIKTFTLRSSSDSKTSYLGKEKEVAHADVGASPNCSSPIASCIKAQSLQEGLMHPLSHWWGWRGQGWLSVCWGGCTWLSAGELCLEAENSTIHQHPSAGSAARL